MRHLIASALLLASLNVVGCASQAQDEGVAEDPIDLDNSLDDGKADSISGKRLVPIETEEETLQPGSGESSIYRGTIEVKTTGDRVLEVRGPRVVVPAGTNHTLYAAVDTADFDLFTNLRFIAMVRSAQGGDWTTVELKGTADPLFGAPYPITINYFAWIDLDAELQKISFEGPTGTATVPLSGLRGEDVEYSFFVFPESGWGSLDGSYDFEIESRLD